MESLQLGPLGAIVTPSLEPEQTTQTIVLLHGFGAPGTDLVGLAAQIDAPPGTRFVFLQAPHTLPGMSGPQAGRAWWHIDMMALQVARMTGQDDMLASITPDGLKEARDALDVALETLARTPLFDWKTTYVGGFSQGAMLSCDWTLRNNAQIAGLIQLSGTVICEEDWDHLIEQATGLRVFQSHSPDDEVLPFSLAERLAKKFKGNGLEHHFVSFRGGHGIGPEVLAKLSRFIR